MRSQGKWHKGKPGSEVCEAETETLGEGEGTRVQASMGDRCFQQSLPAPWHPYYLTEVDTHALDATGAIRCTLYRHVPYG